MRTRLELFSLEAADQKSRLFQMLGMTFAAMLFLTLALLVLSVTVALYFWPTEHRFLALWLLVLLYFLLGAGLALAVWRKLRTEAMPFAATIDELRRDAALIERLREPGPGADSNRPSSHTDMP